MNLNAKKLFGLSVLGDSEKMIKNEEQDKNESCRLYHTFFEKEKY